MLPKSPHKVVQVSKHLWDMVYKSPRKRVIMDEMWSKQKDKKLSKYMYMVGKFRNRKNESKLTQTVNKIKRQYKSLRSTCRSPDIQWSQFYRYTKLYKLTMHNRKYICKLESNDIESIGNFFHSDDSSLKKIAAESVTPKEKSKENVEPKEQLEKHVEIPKEKSTEVVSNETENVEPSYEIEHVAVCMNSGDDVETQDTKDGHTKEEKIKTYVRLLR